MDCVFEDVDNNRLESVLDLSAGATRHQKQKRKSNTASAAVGYLTTAKTDELEFSANESLEDAARMGRSSSPVDFSKRLKLDSSKKTDRNSRKPVSHNTTEDLQYDHEYVLQTLQRLAAEVLYVKKALVELPEKVVADLSGYIKAEVSSQFQTLYRRLSKEIHACSFGSNSTSFLPVASPAHLNNDTFHVQQKSHSISVNTTNSSSVINLSTKHNSGPCDPQTNALSGVATGHIVNTAEQNGVNSSLLQTSKEGGNNVIKVTPEKVESNTFGTSVVQLPAFTTNLVAASLPSSKATVGSPAVIHQSIVSAQNCNLPVNSILNSAHQGEQHGALLPASQPLGASCTNAAMLPLNVVTPKYIQAPVQIRIEDLKQECNVHKVKILDITPTVDIFELADEFIYRIFLKYKYPSIFVQALFVLHYGSFRAMHLNTSSRVKNNLELIPETFITRLTLLVVRWFPSVEDLDFGKCLNQKQRSILSAARSCLFFKKCDACKKRNIDSLPSTYSVKNLTLIAAQQQQQQSVKKEDINRLNMIKPQVVGPTFDISASVAFTTTPPSGITNQSNFIKTENVYPTPPLSDSLSPPSDLSESLTSVFDRVAELVNATGSSNETSVYTVTDLKTTV